MLAGAVCAPVLGRMGDLYGRRRILVIILGVMGVGSLLGAVSWSLPPLLLPRALQSAAFGVIPLGISLLREKLPEDREASGIAMMSSTLGIGGAIGLPLAGLTAEFAGWRMLFWTAALVSLISMVLAWRLVPESAIRAGGRFDAPGAVLLCLALLCLLVPISQSGVWGWNAR